LLSIDYFAFRCLIFFVISITSRRLHYAFAAARPPAASAVAVYSLIIG
jgi:hypothetical protein